MSERRDYGHNHGQNLIETRRIKLVSRSFILRVHEVLTRDTHHSPSARVLAAAQSAGHKAFFRNLCNRRERPVSNSTDPKRKHNCEIVLKPAEVASFSPENKHTRTWRMAPGKRSVSRKGKTFQDGKGMKGAASIGI
jgi:hypothetical protein